MNARERQIEDLLSRPNCPACGRPSRLGDHDCDMPYTVRDARARIEAQDPTSILQAVDAHVTATARDVEQIKINPGTLRQVTQAVRGSSPPAALDAVPAATITGIPVVPDPSLPDDVIAFVGRSRLADEIMDGVDAKILDAVGWSSEPFMFTGGAQVRVDGKILEATVDSIDLTADAYGDLRDAASVSKRQLDEYRWALQTTGLSKAHGLITGITS